MKNLRRRHQDLVPSTAQSNVVHKYHDLHFDSLEDHSDGERQGYIVAGGGCIATIFS